MEVDELFDVIDEAFGRRRWLQHSPVSPDVWEGFLEVYPYPLAQGPEPRCDLLLTASSGSEPGQIRSALAQAIHFIGRGSDDAEIAANTNSVAARLTLVELVCGAVPLTRWWQALPENLKTIHSLRMAVKNTGYRFETSNEVEFFSFAATAGLVRLLSTGRSSSLVQERDLRRNQSFGESVAKSERGARVGVQHMTPQLLEMLGAFDELLSWIEYIHSAPPRTAVEHIHANRRSQLAVAFSRKTIKADATENLFKASTANITWAVVDSGIDATHPCFAGSGSPVAPDVFSSRVYETYDFTRVRVVLANPSAAGLDPQVAQQLQGRLQDGLSIDWSLLKNLLRVQHDASYVVPHQEHGTHVAGIIGASWPCPPAPQEVIGVCPDIRLLDIRVFDDQGTTDEFTILSALQFLGYLNSVSSVPLIHGVNLSFSIAHKVRSFGCGRTPICEACERMTKDGIVVVASAGNAGFTGDSGRPSLDDRYATVSITDPGNAEAAITVGSTHKISPVSYGVSYFSSRGPTGDGRSKPDILAPGEKILSALPGGRYGEMDGTSMAAPHVSGAAAILLARYPELIGRPAAVKKILCASATDLGRERAFQGAGLVDVLRAIQSPWKEM